MTWWSSLVPHHNDAHLVDSYQRPTFFKSLMVASLTTAPIHNLVQIFFPFKREKTIGLYESACLAVLNKLRATASSISAFWDLYTISLIQMTLRLSCSDNRTSSGGGCGDRCCDVMGRRPLHRHPWPSILYFLLSTLLIFAMIANAHQQLPRAAGT